MLHLVNHGGRLRDWQKYQHRFLGGVAAEESRYKTPYRDLDGDAGTNTRRQWSCHEAPAPFAIECA
jgi:hypothetical protein